MKRICKAILSISVVVASTPVLLALGVVAYDSTAQCTSNEVQLIVREAKAGIVSYSDARSVLLENGYRVVDRRDERSSVFMCHLPINKSGGWSVVLEYEGDTVASVKSTLFE